MPASKLPPLTFHQLPLPKPRKRSGILVRAGLAESYAQIFSNQISENGLILSTNALFFAPFIHGNGEDTPTASPNYCGRAENLFGIFFYGTEPEPPPYPINNTQAKELFGKYFRLNRDLKVSDSVPMFAGMERWQEWERTP